MKAAAAAPTLSFENLFMANLLQPHIFVRVADMAEAR
jgi:hypothetical protein